MIVVADTGPLNYLIRLGYVGLLQRLYGKVIVPDAVLEEMLHAGAPAEVREWARDLPAWAESMSTPQLLGSLPPWLGAGESAAILLAESVSADLVLMDEYRGRKVALARGLKVGGTLAILAAGARLDLLDFKEQVRNLRGIGFRVTEELVQTILAEFDL